MPPKGVKLLAIVYFLFAGYLLLIGTLLAVAPATLQALGFGPNPEASVRLSGWGFFSGSGALAGAVGYGLWRLKRWAYSIANCGAATALIVRLMSFFRVVSGQSTPNVYVNVAAFTLLVAALWFLWTPGVRAAFGLRRRLPAGDR